MSAYDPCRFRITVEYVTYDQAKMAREILRSTVPDVFVYDALDRDGEPMWHEEGSLNYRPERDA